MKALKAIVVAMAVVLLVGFGALIVMWQSKHGAKPAAVAPAAGVPAPPVAVGDGTVAIPEGSRVLAVGSSERHVDLLVENPDGTRDVYQVTRDGTLAGVLRARAGEP